jgi:serine/threonine protein kinase
MVSRFHLCEAASAEMTSGSLEEEAQRFGPYVLLHVAGAGGMGRVQLALSGRLGMSKLSVLKRIHSDAGNPEQEARFRREAMLALRLSHGAIAQTFAVDEIEGELCISQEFIEGASLGLLLRSCRSVQERVPTAIAIHIARELARALAYAHTLDGGGVVHRDVVPDNVMLSYAGEVKLIDFGIAKIAGDASLTQTGMIVGRLSHTAPEVLGGRSADARADLYSLGVVMWELLTGATPDEVREHGTGKKGAMFPAPSTRAPEVPAAVDALVLKLLAADPSARYQRAEEVQQALGELLMPGFVGDKALAELLAHHFEIDRERDFLAIEVARAQRWLGPVANSAPPARAGAAAKPVSGGAASVVDRRDTPSVSMSIPTTGGAGKVAAVALTATILIVGSLWWRGGERRPRARTQEVVALPSLARPAVPEVPSPPPTSVAELPAPKPVAPTAAQAPAPPAAALAAPPPEPTPPLAAVPAPAEPAAVEPAEGVELGAEPGEKLPARQPVASARPGDPPTGQSATLITQAQESFERGELPQALVLARSAARAGGGYRAHLIAGRALLADGRMAEAETELVQAARLAPSGNPDAATLLERVRARRQRMGQ